MSKVKWEITVTHFENPSGNPQLIDSREEVLRLVDEILDDHEEFHAENRFDPTGINIRMYDSDEYKTD